MIRHQPQQWLVLVDDHGVSTADFFAGSAVGALADADDQMMLQQATAADERAKDAAKMREPERQPCRQQDPCWQGMFGPHQQLVRLRKTEEGSRLDRDGPWSRSAVRDIFKEAAKMPGERHKSSIFIVE